MYGSQPKLSSVVESSVQAFSLGSIPKILICDNNLNGHLRKELNFGDTTTSFSAKWRLEMTAEISYPRQIWVVLLIAIFPRHTTNQKHYPDLGIGTSSVWNFCSHFSDVNSQGHQWWCWKISAVFSDGCSVQLMQGCHAAGCSHVGSHRPRCRPKQLLFSQGPVYIWRKVVMGRRDITLPNVVSRLREKQ